MKTNKKMQKKYRVYTWFIFLMIMGLTQGVAQSNGESLTKRRITSEELLKWDKWGDGEITHMGEQLCIKEADESKGIMLVSPSSFNGTVVLKFKVLALTSASVMAVVLAATDEGKAKLSIPDSYDGSFGLWQKKNNYFFAFKNASHNKTPFVVKYGNPFSGEELASAEDNYMMAGKYYSIELGKKENTLWLSIDGEKMFEVEDTDHPFQNGHVALRVRGTVGLLGAILIKDLKIYTEAN